MTKPNEEPLTCWCGEKGTQEDLFNIKYLDQRCGGFGTLNCYCGGDICACHNHGSVDCPGCSDCEDGDYDYEDYDDWRECANDN